MRYLPTGKLVPGMALGQDIYDGAGRLLLAKHLLLTEEYIANLEFQGFPGLYVDDEFSKGIEIQQVLSPEVRSQALTMIHDLFTFHSDVGKVSVNEIKLQKTVERVVEDILSNGDVMCNMMDIRDYSDYIYFHSINVSTLSAMLGARYGLPQEALCQLASAAMLHDIGKRFLDFHIVSDEDELAGEERELLRRHPKIGAEYLKDHYFFASVVYTGVLAHHEWYDGSGYPMAMTGTDIPLFARIIRLADSYDKMVTKHPSKEACTPSDTMEYMMAMAGREFDPELVRIFIKQMAVYPVGCEVELSNGWHAVVVENFENFALRPLVKVIGTEELLNLRDDPAARSVTVGRMVI